MNRQARLTEPEVQAAIQQLQEQGVDNPSIRQIYQTLGQKGSFSKIIEFKKQMLAPSLANNPKTVTQLDNSVTLIDNTLNNSVTYSSHKLANSEAPSVINLDNLEARLWERIETRLKEWESRFQLPEPNPNPQVSELEAALNEMHDLWLEAMTQCAQLEAQVQELKSQPKVIPSKSQTGSDPVIEEPIQPSSPSDPIGTETDLLEIYFQILIQLQSLKPTQKYDYAMRLFEKGVGPSEASRVLGVNKGSLQHYKDGKRKRPHEEE